MGFGSAESWWYPRFASMQHWMQYGSAVQHAACGPHAARRHILFGPRQVPYLLNQQSLSISLRSKELLQHSRVKFLTNIL